MEMCYLTFKTKNIIKKRLKIEDVADVLDRDYSEQKIDREKVSRFQKMVRGSLRLRLGLFRTQEEGLELIERAKSLKLP